MHLVIKCVYSVVFFFFLAYTTHARKGFEISVYRLYLYIFVFFIDPILIFNIFFSITEKPCTKHSFDTT